MNYRSYMFVVVWILLATSGLTSSQTNDSPQLVESRTLNLKVIKLFNEAKYDEALPLAKRALELRQAVLGPSHQDLVPLHTNIAEIYRAKNQRGQARSYFEHALTIAEQTFTENNLQTAALLDKLGYIAYEQRELNDAEKFFKRSLVIKEKALSPDEPSVGRTVFNLAEIYRLRSDLKKAEPLYERAVGIYEKVQDKDRADLIRVLQGYFATLHELKKTDQAAEVQQRLGRLLSDQGIVQGGVLNGKALKLVQPPYPMSARSDRAQGLVRVQIVIDENGKVISAETINRSDTHPALAAAAENAALKSLFTPTYLSGAPVRVSGIIIYRFVGQ